MDRPASARNAAPAKPLAAPSNAVARLRDRVTAKLGRRTLARVAREHQITPCEGLETLGSEWGGWTVPTAMIEPEWVAWCVGAGGDVSFDLELLRRGCRVRCVDPYEVFGAQAIQQAGGDERFVFVEAAIATRDGPITMFGRQDAEQGGVSAVNSYRVTTSFQKPGQTLATLMAEQADDRCDLLKLDIEGSEYDVLAALDPVEHGVRVLCVELHETVPPSRARELMADLGREYALVAVDGVAELSYVRRDLL